MNSLIVELVVRWAIKQKVELILNIDVAVVVGSFPLSLYLPLYMLIVSKQNATLYLG